MDEEKALITDSVGNAENIVKGQMDAKSGPVRYLMQPREQRDQQADKLVRHIYSMGSIVCRLPGRANSPLVSGT